MEGDIYYLDGRIEHKNAGGQKDRAEEHDYTFRQEDEHNQTLGSLYTDKYYESSELPADWYDDRELEMKNGTEKRESTSNNARFN